MRKGEARGRLINRLRRRLCPDAPSRAPATHLLQRVLVVARRVLQTGLAAGRVRQLHLGPRRGDADVRHGARAYNVVLVAGFEKGWVCGGVDCEGMAMCSRWTHWQRAALNPSRRFARGHRSAQSAAGVRASCAARQVAFGPEDSGWKPAPQNLAN
jgi:hypothetical protein